MSTLPKTLLRKSHCQVNGMDGHILNILYAASRTLRENGMVEQAREMQNRIIHCQSYHSALSIIGDYVILTGLEARR